MLFKSPRDSSQATHLAKQMFPGHVTYMQQSSQDATKRSYVYLLCDLKPETPTNFRLRSNIFLREDSGRLRQKSIKSMNHIKFLQLTMAQRRRKNHDFLKLLAKCTPAQRKAILKVAHDTLVRTICECFLNVLEGTVPVSKPAKKKLLLNKKSLIALAKKNIPLHKKKKLLVIHGGNFLSVLLPPVHCVISSILVYNESR